MEFPDRPHLRKLSDALWAGDLSGKASVMVGAGVSANARPADSDGVRFPTWAELTDRMMSELAEASSTDIGFPKSFPRVASEYEAAFGPKALHDLILASIPDRKYLPSVIHEKLLSLPWRDVFTTNYDTLLERTFVQGRSFHVVTKVSDLARGTSPRICKLHGSFPSDTPFIITEEDFRTYPTRFAPFVNTVRQSLIENVFVLFGFSGDDPNFLEWSGWVRDQLGEDHCPIYLCGLLGLDTPRRRLLEKRGVTPIDLSHPYVDLKNRPDRHAIALERVLDELAGCEPSSPTRWPRADSSFEKPAGSGDSISLLSRTPFAKAPRYEFPITNETLADLFRSWKHDRELYPGWIVAPEDVRERVWVDTSHWIGHISDLTNEWSEPARLLLLHELNWRLELCHSPMFGDFVEAFEELVSWTQSLDPDQPTFRASELELEHVPVSELRDASTVLRMALLRDARESFEADRWNTIFSSIDEQSQTTFALSFERVLNLLWSGQRQSARSAALGLPPCETPLEKMKKASIFAELDDLRNSRRLAEQALFDTRGALRFDPESIRLLSLESWLIYLLLHVDEPHNFEEKREFDQLSWKRLRELRTYDCDSSSIKSAIEKNLERKQPVIRQSKREHLGFDPLSKTVSYNFGSDLLKQFLPAFSYIRLFERGAVPVRMPFYSTTSDSFRAALDWTSTVSSGWPYLLLIRRGDLKTLEATSALSREEIVLMPRERFDAILDAARSAFNDLLPAPYGPTYKGDLCSLTVASEILSRLVIRMSPEQLDLSFAECCRLHNSPFVNFDLELEKVSSRYFKRLFFAARQTRLSAWLPEILRLPPLSENESDTENDFRRKEDPFALVEISWLQSLEPSAELSEEIRGEIEKLFSQLKLQKGILFEGTLSRLILIALTTSLLSENQNSELGNWIWFEGSKRRDVPLTPRFKSAVSLDLPHPNSIEPEVELKHHVWKQLGSIKRETLDPDTPDLQPTLKKIRDSLGEVCGATATFDATTDQGGCGIRWSKTESRNLLREFSEIWTCCLPALHHLAPQSAKAAMFGIDRTGEFLETASTMLSDAIIPFLGKISKADKQNVEKIIQTISDLGHNPIDARIEMLRLYPEESPSVEKELREALSSPTDEEQYNLAARAIFLWGVRSETIDEFPRYPAALIDRMARDLAFRIENSISTGFSFFTSCLEHRPMLVSRRNLEILVESLPGWEISTRMGSSDGDPAQRLNHRYLLSRFVRSVLQLKEGAVNKIANKTMLLLSEDPLPEIQFLFSRGTRDHSEQAET